MTTLVFVPGYGNSLGDHWQRRWYDEALAAGEPAVWVEQADWEGTDPDGWVGALAATLGPALVRPGDGEHDPDVGPDVDREHDPDVDPDVALVAHSLGVLTVVRWAARHPRRAARLAGALLVAAPDPASPAFPAQLPWGEVELSPLPFASCLVASDDDPFATPQRGAAFAQAWGARLVRLGAAGHINAAAGYGAWPRGPRLLMDVLVPA